MAKRAKEEERIEKIIRGLLKLPENKRCINCNSLGPQYVCTTFWTFVCTTCSGMHREFTHRVKSVSMAKFTDEEVSALQAGGNERARQIYLKAWDPQRHSLPDGRNPQKLREFIKHVYVDRKYAGERNMDPLPQLKMNKPNESCDRKPSADTSGRHSNERPGSSGRHDLIYYHDEWRSSPRYARDNSRSGGFKRSPIRFEVVDDRFRDDGNPRGRKFDPRRTSSVEVMARSLSPVPQKNANRSMSPVVRPVSDLLGVSVPHSQGGDPAEGNKEKSEGASANNHKKDPSTIVGGSTAEEQAPQDKREVLTSLIDFDVHPQQTTSQTITEKQTNKSAASASVNTSANASITTLEYLLFELDVPTTAAPASEQQSNNNDSTSTVPSEDTSIPAGDTSLVHSTFEPAASDANQLINAPKPPTLHSSSDQSGTVTHGQQPKVNNVPAPSSSFQSASTKQSGSYIGTNNNQDLFSLTYPAVPGWQTGQPHAMGFGMHYHQTPYQPAGFPNSIMSTNPFDSSDGNGSRSDQSEMFPSMASLQEALPSMPSRAGFLSAHIPGTQFMPHPPYSSGTHLGHQHYPHIDSRHDGFGTTGVNSGFDFDSLSSNQSMPNKSSADIMQNFPPSTRRNPFE